jgi:exopolysaccharide biosynthesis WecB/TagA/CpsF family protein
MRILGVHYHNATFQEALGRACGRLEDEAKSNLFFLNLDCLYQASRDEEYRLIINNAGLVLPDGIGLKIATRLFGGRMKEDCNGTDFSPVFLKEIARRGYGIYLLGGEEGIAATAAKNLRKKIPGIRIVGTHCGYFEDEDAVVEDINRSGTDVLFVAMGVPLQEKWIARNRHRLESQLCLGVGALLDYLSGEKIRAPKYLRILHLEWLWRIFREPGRFFKRYVLHDLRFICYLFFVSLSRKLGTYKRVIKKSLALVVVFAALICGRFVFAEQNNFHWDFAGWYGGGCYPNVEFDPNIKDRVYLTSDVAGIWRSDDGGERWFFATNGLGHLNVAQVAVAESDSNVLYAATKGGLFYSLNGGGLWEKSDDMEGAISFERPRSYKAIAVSRIDPGKLCVGTAKGKLFCSRTYGREWDEIKTDFQKTAPDSAVPTVSALVFVSDEEELMATNSSGLFQYDFTTGIWEPLLTESYSVTDFSVSGKTAGWIVAAGENHLMMSRDGGRSWQKSADVPNGKTYRVLLDESEDTLRIIVAWLKDWQGGLVVSDDGGQSWEELGEEFRPDIASNPTRAWVPSKGKPASLKMDPFDPQRLFLSDWWGVWRSDDGGRTWTETVNGAPNTVGSDIVVSAQGEIFVATMDTGLLKSSDQGRSYRALFPQDGYRKDSNGHVWRVLVPGEGRIIATSSPWGENVNQVIISEDGGDTFEIVRTGLPDSRPKENTVWHEGYPRALAADPADPDVFYLGMDGDDGGGLFVSVDAGRSWQRTSGQPGSLKIYNGLVVDRSDPDVLFWGACGKDGGVFRSTDRGKTWQKVFSQTSWIFDLHMSSDGVLYAAGASGHPVVYVSEDKGLHWKKLGEFSLPGASAAEAIITPRNRPEVVAVSTVNWNHRAPQKIYLSRDAGQTWMDITGDLPSGPGTAAMAFDPKGHYLYVSRYSGSVYKIALFDLSA